MGLSESVGKFSWKIWGGKVLKKAATAGAAYVAGKAAAVGVDVDQAQVTAAIFVGIEALRNIAKHHFPKQLGWL